MNIKKRVVNPYFWLGVGGVVLTAIHVTPETFTSWSILSEKVIDVLSNPYMLGSVIVAIFGVLNNPTTKGITDNEKE